MLQNLPTHSWGNEEINLLLAEAYKLKYMFADAPKHLSQKKWLCNNIAAIEKQARQEAAFPKQQQFFISFPFSDSWYIYFWYLLSVIILPYFSAMYFCKTWLKESYLKLEELQCVIALLAGQEQID